MFISKAPQTLNKFLVNFFNQQKSWFKALATYNTGLFTDNKPYSLEKATLNSNLKYHFTTPTSSPRLSLNS